MNTTELGVYILGAVALAILAAAGIVAGNHFAIVCVILASGCAYVAQLCAAFTVAQVGGKLALTGNLAFMAFALVFWGLGAVSLMVA